MDIDERISVRFHKKELQDLDSMVNELGYSSRSEFIRVAVASHKENLKKLPSIESAIPPLILDYIDTLVEHGHFRSRVDALNLAIHHYFGHDMIESTMKAIKGMEIAAGRHIVLEAERKESLKAISQ